MDIKALKITQNFFSKLIICKYLRRILKFSVTSYLRKIMPKLLRSMPGDTVETIGFDFDHVHLVMSIPTKYRISLVLGGLKSQLASKLRKKFLWLSKVYWKEYIVWSPDYFVSSVGVDEETIRRLVKYQGFQDSGQLPL